MKILGAVATTTKERISRFTIRNKLGVPKSGYGEYAYSNIYKNTNFLVEKGFLRVTQTRTQIRKGKTQAIPMFDVTVKGALASLFSPLIDESKASELLETWRVKDWGQGYYEPFLNVQNPSELRRIVESIYLDGGSLENVSEDVLKRSLRDPEEREKWIREGKIERTIKGVTTALLPDSVALVRGEMEPKIRGFLIAPALETCKVISDLIKIDSSVEDLLRISLLEIVRTLGFCLMKKQQGENAYIYFSDPRMSVLGFAVPENVKSLLPYPKKALECAAGAFEVVIEHFLKDPEFVQGKKPLFTWCAMKYDPLTKELSFLSPVEMKQESSRFLKQL